MKNTWKFPALVRGIAPNPKEERLCLVAGEAEFEIREADLQDMPLVMRAEMHYLPEPVEYRLFDGELYKAEDETLETLQIELDCMDVMSHGNSFIFKPIALDVIDVLKSGAVLVWPKDAHLKTERGARDLATSGVSLLPGGADDLVKWRERFQRNIDRFLIADGKIWMRTREPIYVVDLQYHQLLVDDATIFAEKHTEWGTRQTATTEKGGKYRIFSINDLEEATTVLEADAVTQGKQPHVMDTIEVLRSDVVRLDIDRLEMDRLARACSVCAGKNFSRTKPGGGETLLEVSPESLATTWIKLRDFLRNYNPLDGIPEELEEKFTAFIGEADGFAGVYGPVLIPEALRTAVAYSFGRWENRSIDFAADKRFAAAR
jgi:hypothetical protein